MKKVLIFLGIVLLMIVACDIDMEVNASSESDVILSKGRYEFDYDQSGIAGDHPLDVVIDADDFDYIYELCR